MDSKSWVWSA